MSNPSTGGWCTANPYLWSGVSHGGCKSSFSTITVIFFSSTWALNLVPIFLAVCIEYYSWQMLSPNGLGLAMCQQDLCGQLQAPSLSQCSTTLGTTQPLWEMPIILPTQHRYGDLQRYVHESMGFFLCEKRNWERIWELILPSKLREAPAWQHCVTRFYGDSCGISAGISLIY